MVRSKQMSELAGVMDGQLSDQPTLKRFSRFNQSMHSRVPPSCFYEPTCSHSQPIHSQTYSKGGKLKTSIFGGNWTLRERKDHRPSVHNIVVKKEHAPSTIDKDTQERGRKQSESYSGVRLSGLNTSESLISTDSCNHSPLQRRARKPIDRSGSISSDYGSKQNVNERFLAVRPCGGMTFNADRHWRTSNRADADRQHWQVPGGHPDYHRSQPNHRERIIPIEMNDDYSIIDDSCSASTTTSPSRANASLMFAKRNIPFGFKGGQARVPENEPRKSHWFSTRNRFFPMKGVKEVDRHQSQSTYSTQCDSNNADESTSTAVCDEDGNKLDSTEEIIEQRGTIIGVSSVSEFDDDDFDSFDEQSPYGDEIREEIREICNEVKALPNFDNTWERSTNELNSALNSTVTNESDEVRPSVAASNKRFSTLSTPADDRHAIPLSPTKKFTTHLVIDADSAYPSDASDSSPSSASSNADGQICPVRKSCPDLRLSAGSQCRNFEAHQIHGPHEQRSKIKRLTTQWSTKPLSEWTLDDVILWLQSCKLDEVASIIIGYDIGGSDIENWDDAALIQLGIIGEETRRTLLAELSTIKERQMKTSNSVSRLHSSKDKTRLPLFSLVRSDNYDQVIAVETSLSTRDITVAEGRLGCLQVTKVNGANIPLCEQDCFLEINGRPGRGFRSPLMFTKLVSEAAGEPIRIVVLRRRCSTKEVHCDSPESAEYLQQTLSNTEKESSASSGISSSEFYSDVTSPANTAGPTNSSTKSEVLRL